MLNAFLAMSILLFIYSLLHHFPFSSPMILRLHSNALRDLGEMTRNWMRDSVQRHFPLRSHSKHLAHRFGQGRLQLHNLSIVDFTPPQVHFQATKNSLIYMTTDGGTSQLDAQWSLQSDFLLSLIRSPAFSGSVRARIGGFSADVSIKIVERSHLAIHQCISRFDEFQLYLGGSLAADLIHWFHRPLAQALQSHVEETYCQLIGEKLLPWLHDQLAKLALKLQVDFGAELQLSQWLHSAKIGEGHLDLGMAQRLNQRGGEKGSRERILAESLPLEMPTAKIREKNGHSLELFLHESTLQQVFSGAHHSHQLRANFSSPFLRTNCPLLCLGKFVPQMRDALGPTQLLAVVCDYFPLKEFYSPLKLRTNNPPNVRLFEQRIRLNLNASFELFLENWKIERGKDEKGVELMENYDGMEEEGNGQFDKEMDEKIEEEEFTEIEEERERRIEVWKKGNELDEKEEEEKEDKEDGTLIRPKFVGVNGGGGPRIIDFGQAKASTTTMSTIVFTESTTRKGEMESTMSIGPISKKPKLPPILGSHGEPILRIVLDSEMEILLELEKKRRRLKTELKLTKVRAVLTQSEVRNLSQKTIDLLVEASIPFLENSVRILYRDGIELDNLMAMPSGNESIIIEDGFIRYGADVHLAQILQ